MSATEFLPPKMMLPSLRRAAEVCEGCELHKSATQTVFGEGPKAAQVMFIGEAPGDLEDRSGHPFVGGAGHLLDEALAESGIDRRDVYVTNAVKHFKWEPRGQRRLHKKPSAREIAACRPWWEAEIRVVKPRVVVCLGATAAQELFGSAFRITQQRGHFLPTEWCPLTIATYHPAAILRAPTPDQRLQLREDFLSDLHLVAEHIRS